MNYRRIIVNASTYSCSFVIHIKKMVSKCLFNISQINFLHYLINIFDHQFKPRL